VRQTQRDRERREETEGEVSQAMSKVRRTLVEKNKVNLSIIINGDTI
jgi:hypothetical protein